MVMTIDNEKGIDFAIIPEKGAGNGAKKQGNKQADPEVYKLYRLKQGRTLHQL